MTITLKHLGPGDIDWLVEQHGTHYAKAEGFDDSFGALVADILHDFDARHDPTCERGFIAWEGAQRLGSIFCVRIDAETAKLRLFLLVPEARGKGLGKHLLKACMTFARQAGYRRMQLSTHESHRAACALYASTGWTMTRATPVHSFGVDLVEQAWEIEL
ncbi:GNAT family N-acetyltransferase [Primorskyibacter sp. 2E107]|uniref:GNAT family N-acetyltransferase n=1 Tax=Primorskyibacter sp. 2E107 TaxID=3403458 RepID=UPI003AF7A8D9